MKSFRQILGEVAQPKPEEERAFKDMHSYETMPHPVALDHQFTGAIGADDLPREKAKRIADQEGDANYDTSYDDAFEYAGPSFDESVELDEAEDLQELSIGTLSKYVQKKVGKNARASESLKAMYALSKVPAFNKLNKADKDAAMKVIKDQEAMVKKSEKGINLAKLKATAKADKLGIDIVFGKDGKSMSRSKISMDEDFREQADQAIVNRLSEGSAMAKSAALSKASATSKSGKAKVSLKKAPWDKNEEVELDEASASVYKDMPKAPGKMISNRVQVKAFKDANAMGAFLSKQNDNSWQDTGVSGLKSGKYKIDMVKKGGKPSKNFIKVNEEVELDEAPRRKGAPKMTGDSVAIQRAKDAEHNKAMGRTKTGRKKPVRTMTSTQKSLASMRRECAGEVELDEGFSPKQIEQLKKAYASMPDRVPMDMAQKMGAMLKKRSKEELIAIARADIKWLSTTAATNLIMQGVKASEING